jgi:hypothetical protein
MIPPKKSKQLVDVSSLIDSSPSESLVDVSSLIDTGSEKKNGGGNGLKTSAPITSPLESPSTVSGGSTSIFDNQNADVAGAFNKAPMPQPVQVVEPENKFTPDISNNFGLPSATDVAKQNSVLKDNTQASILPVMKRKNVLGEDNGDIADGEDEGIKIAKEYATNKKAIDTQKSILNSESLNTYQDANVAKGDMATPQLFTPIPVDKSNPVIKDIDVEKNNVAVKENELYNETLKKAGKYVAKLNANATTAGLATRAILGDKNAEQQSRFLDKGLPVAPSDLFYNDKQGLEALSLGVDEQYKDDLENPEYKAKVKDIQTQYETLIDKYPEFKRQQIAKIVAQQIMKDHPNFNGSMSALPNGLKAAKELGLSDDDIKNIDFDNLPIQSPLSSAVGAIYNGIIGLGAGAGRILGSAVGMDKDVLTANLSDATTKAAQRFEDVSGTQQLPTIADADKTSPTYLQDIKNPEAGKYNYNFHTISNAIGHGVGSLAQFIGGTKVVGGIVKGIIPVVDATEAGMAGIMVVGGYEPYYQQARATISDKPEDESKRHAYALLNGMIDYLSFRTLGKVVKDISPSVKDEAAEIFKNSSSLATVNREALTKWTDKVVKGIQHTAGETAFVGAAQASGEVAKNIVGNVIGTKEAADKSNKELGNVLLAGVESLPFALAIPIGISKVIAGTRSSFVAKENMYNAGMNPETYLAQTHKLMDDGVITQDQLNQRAQVINTAAKVISLIPTDIEMNHNQRVAYTNSKVREMALKAQRDKVDDIALEKYYDDQIKEEIAARTEIINGGGKEPSYVTPEADTKLTEPIVGVDAQGIPIGDNVPAPENNKNETTQNERDINGNVSPIIDNTNNNSTVSDRTVLPKVGGNEVRTKAEEEALYGKPGEPRKKLDFTEGKPIVEPTKPISEMNSEEIGSYATEVRQALNRQEKEFVGKTEKEKEDGGYYDYIDNVAELRDTEQRVNFVENSGNLDDLANSTKSALRDLNKDNPSQESLAILNAAKKKAAEMNIEPETLIKEVIKRVGNDYKDKNDAEFMMRNYLEKIVPEQSTPQEQGVGNSVVDSTAKDKGGQQDGKGEQLGNNTSKVNKIIKNDNKKTKSVGEMDNADKRPESGTSKKAFTGILSKDKKVDNTSISNGAESNTQGQGADNRAVEGSINPRDFIANHKAISNITEQIFSERAIREGSANKEDDVINKPVRDRLNAIDDEISKMRSDNGVNSDVDLMRKIAKENVSDFRKLVELQIERDSLQKEIKQDNADAYRKETERLISEKTKPYQDAINREENRIDTGIANISKELGATRNDLRWGNKPIDEELGDRIGDGKSAIFVKPHETEIETANGVENINDGLQVELVTVNPKNRNEGLAKKRLQEITQAADKHQIPLFIDIVPQEKGVTKEGLRKLYEQYGFRFDGVSGKREPNIKEVKQATTESESNTGTTKPVSTTIPASKEKSKGQEDKGSVQPSPKPIGQPNAEVAPAVLKEGKYAAKAKKIADNIRKADIPQWLINTDPTIKQSGVSADSLKNAFADAVEHAGKLLDKGVEIKDALKEAADKIIDHILTDYPKGAKLKSEREQQLRDGFENYYKENILAGEEIKSDAGKGNRPPTEEVKVAAGEDNTIGIRHVDTAEMRQELSLPEYQKEAQTVEQWNIEADARIKKGEMPLVLNKFKEGIDPSPVEQVMMGKYIAELGAKAKGTMSDKDISALHDAVKLSDKVGGSNVGASLRARQIQFVRDDSLEGFILTKMESNAVDKLTDKQKADVKKQHEDYQKANDKWESEKKRLEAKVAKLEAEKELKKVIKAKGVNKTHEDYVVERQSLREKLMKQVEEYKSGGKKLGITNDGNVESFILTAKMAKTIGEIVKSHVFEIGNKLGEVTKRTFDDVKDIFDGITEKDIHDVIAGKYNEPQKTRSERMKDLVDLKMQAKLVNRLSDLENGKQPTTEKKRIERNQETTDLRRKIADAIKENPDNEKLLAALKKRIATDIKKVQSDIDNKRFAPEKKQPAPIQLDKEATDAMDELIRVKNERHLGLLREQYEATKGTPMYYLKGASEILNIPRSLMSSADFSAVLRQAIIPSISHPAMAFRAGKAMFESAVSQKAYDRWFFEYQQSPRYKLIEKSKLGIADSTSPLLTIREEAFMSNLAERIPIIGPTIIKGSERAYTMYLNKMRVDLFNRFADSMEARGLTFENSPEQYKQMANYVNSATGRGDLGNNLNKIAPLLNSLFFSPRLIASRLNMLTYFAQPRFYKSVPKEVRQSYFTDMGKFAALGLTVLALASLNKDNKTTVETNPTSSDFGKIRNGDTRWDIWGGFQQYIRIAAQVSMGERTSNGKTTSLGEKSRFGETRLTPIGGAIRSKLAPIPAMAVDMFSGRTAIGDRVVYEMGLFKETKYKEIPIDKYILEHILPLTSTGMYDAYKDQGAKSFGTVLVPSMLGVGVQTYSSKKKSSGGASSSNY